MSDCERNQIMWFTEFSIGGSLGLAVIYIWNCISLCQRRKKLVDSRMTYSLETKMAMIMVWTILHCKQDRAQTPLLKSSCQISSALLPGDTPKIISALSLHLILIRFAAAFPIYSTVNFNPLRAQGLPTNYFVAVRILIHHL